MYIFHRLQFNKISFRGLDSSTPEAIVMINNL